MALHPLEVVGAVPATGEPQRLDTVQVLIRTGLQPGLRRDVQVGVATDRHVGVDVDGDAAECVDQLLEAGQILAAVAHYLFCCEVRILAHNGRDHAFTVLGVW